MLDARRYAMEEDSKVSQTRDLVGRMTGKTGASGGFKNGPIKKRDGNPVAFIASWFRCLAAIMLGWKQSGAS